MVSTPFRQRSELTLFFQRGFDASASTSLSSLFLSSIACLTAST